MKTIVVILAISFVAVLHNCPEDVQCTSCGRSMSSRHPWDVLRTPCTIRGDLTDEQKEKLKTYKESCISESGVDPNVVKNAKEGVIDENDEKLACFATCMLKKTGMMKANGDIDIEMVRSKMSSSVSQEETDRIINACKDITGTGCWKGGKIMKCVMENKAPILH